MPPGSRRLPRRRRARHGARRARTLRLAAAPIVEFLRAIPPPALIPFGIVALGTGTTMKVFLIAFVCVWPVLLNTLDGVRGVEPTLQETARVYRIGRPTACFASCCLRRAPRSSPACGRASRSH